MANITITIPDAQLTRVVDGLCGFDNLTDVVLTRPQYAKKKLIEFVKNSVNEYESGVARQAVLPIVLPDIT